MPPAAPTDTGAKPPRFFYGWWIVFASAAIVFFTGGTFFYGFGALIEPLTDEFGWSRAAISVAFSLRTEVGGVAAPVVGFAVDRVGSRKVIMVGIVLVASGFILLSQIDALWGFYACIALIATGNSACNSAAAATSIAHWFRKYRGRALGLLTFGGGVSGATVLIMTGLIDSFGWREALLICGVGQLLFSLPLAFSLRDRPEDMGLPVDGIPEPELEEGETETRAQREAGEGLTTREALRHPTFWKMAVSLTLGNLATTTIIVHLVPFLTSNVQMSPGLAAATVTCMTAISLIGRLGFGYLADIFPNRIVMSVAYGLIALSMLLFATVHEPWQIIYALPVFALGFGGNIPARSTIQVEYFGLKAFGAIQGLMLTVSTFGGVAGPILAGLVYDSTESYRLAFAILACGSALAVPLMLSARRPRPVAAAA